MIVTPRSELVKRVSIEALAEYAKTFISSIMDFIAKANLVGINQVILQFDIRPGQEMDLKIAVRPSKPVDPQLKKDVSDLSQKVPVIDVMNGPVQFQIYFPVQQK